MRFACQFALFFCADTIDNDYIVRKLWVAKMRQICATRCCGRPQQLMVQKHQLKDGLLQWLQFDLAKPAARRALAKLSVP